jgi:hypothetical protein
VTVENRPDVRVVQPTPDDPFRVNIQNWRQVSEGQGGMSAQDSENLERLMVAAETLVQEEVPGLRRVVTLGLGLLLFLGAGLAVLSIPRVR